MVAYVAGVAVLASVAPVIHAATLTVGSQRPLLSDQSDLSNEVPAISVCEPTTESFSPSPSSLPLTVTTRPLSFLINLFHLVAFSENAMSSTYFPRGQDSAVSASTNGTTCPRLSGKYRFHSHCCLTEAHKGVSGCQQSVLKRNETESCNHISSRNQHLALSHYLLSPSPASELVIPPWITSPLPDAHNTSFLFRFDTFLEPV